MKIERANSEHLDWVAFLFDRYRVFYRQASNLDAAKNFIQSRLQQQDAVIFLATEDNQPLGYTQLFSSWSSVAIQRVWILNDLFVLPEHRNRGIAKALMGRAEAHAIATKATRIILATEVTNKIGQKLYASMGYRQFDEFYHYVLKIDS